MVPLKQISIVTGDLDSETIWSQFTGFSQSIGDSLCMSDHRVRERGKIGVFPKQNLGRNRFRDLSQRAVRTPGQFERPGIFAVVKLILAQQRIRQGGLSQRQYGIQADLAAYPACHVVLMGLAVG